MAMLLTMSEITGLLLKLSPPQKPCELVSVKKSHYLIPTTNYLWQWATSSALTQISLY